MKGKSKEQCVRCGSCTVVCPVFRVTGMETLTARGKLHLLSTGLAEHPSSHFQDLFAQCLLCGACENSCPRQLPVCQQVVAARSGFSHLYGRHPVQKTLARVTLSSPALLDGLVKAGLSLQRLSLLPEESGLRIKLGLLEKREHDFRGSKEKKRGAGKVPPESGLSYFSGCLARHLQPSVGEATVQLVESLAGESPFEPDSQMCCGLAAWSAGKIDEARRLARKNMEAFSRPQGAILASCASCSSHLQRYPELFEDDPEWKKKAEAFSSRVVEFTSFLENTLQDRVTRSDVPARVYYHEPCHLRFGEGKKGDAGRLLEQIENVTLVGPGEAHYCCGQGGLFHLGYPELAEKIFSRAWHEFAKGEAELVVTTCSGCLLQWQTGLAARNCPARAVHLATWLRSCMQIKD